MAEDRTLLLSRRHHDTGYAEAEVRVAMGNPFGERGFSLRGASTLGFGVTDENVRAQTRSFCEGDPSAQKGSRRQTVDQNAFRRFIGTRRGPTCSSKAP